MLSQFRFNLYFFQLLIVHDTLDLRIFIYLLTFHAARPRQQPNEVLLYLQEPTPDINTDPLDWWKSNGARYPRLLNVALKYLGVPATSVPSERIFSKAGEIVSRRRSSFHPSSVDMLVHLSKNLDLLEFT